MRKLDGKKVRFIAVDRKYRTEAYPAVAPLSSRLNTYITGQHIDPDDDSTKGNLTLREITGEIEIKPDARRKLFPFVINDVDPVLIIHNKVYDCSVHSNGAPKNPKDYVEAHFIILQTLIVAGSKKDVISRHKFYLEDKDADAKAFVLSSDAVYEAEKMIREKATISDYKELVMSLNLTVSGFNINYKLMTEDRLKEALIKQAKADPVSITSLFTENGKNVIMLAKLVDSNIIKNRVGQGYFDGEQFIAVDSSSFILFIKEDKNAGLLQKWGRLLESKNE